jgi:hypothetical protein
MSDASIQQASQIISDPRTIVMYFAVLMLLLLFLVWSCRGSRAEKITGGGIGTSGCGTGSANTAAPWTSGASQRFAQTPTSTNMGGPQSYNAEQCDLGSVSISSTNIPERLVSTPIDGPEFWDAPQSWQSWRSSNPQASTVTSQPVINPPAPVTTAAAAATTGTEYMRNGSVGAYAEDGYLASML